MREGYYALPRICFVGLYVRVYGGLAERLKNGNPDGEFNELYSLCQLEIQGTTE